MTALVDATVHETVCDELEFATSIVARTRGLMFRGSLPEGAGIVIRPCNSIHMMFMRFRIDAVFFDADDRVTRVARNLRPWLGFALGGRGAKGVIEMPAGLARIVEPGHQLAFIDQTVEAAAPGHE